MSSSNQLLPTTSDFGRNVREVITGIISISIAGIALYILFDTYESAQKPEVAQAIFSKQKDILLLALGFLGTVTGYYFGRVPAEKQADAARDAASKATESENRVKRQVREGLDSIAQHRTVAAGAGADDAVLQEINRLRATLS
jgi:hypothetical protein